MTLQIYIIIFYAVFKEQTIHIFRVYRRCIRFTCLAKLPLRGDVVHLMRLDIHRNLLNCIWYKTI